MTTTPTDTPPQSTPAPAPAAPWYALMIAGGAGFKDGRRVIPEFAAVEAIGDEGHHAFAPTHRILVRRRRHQQKREPAYIPLIPGYVFAQFARIPTRADLRRWAPVYDLVRLNDVPAVIPLHQIKALQALDETDVGIDTTGKPDGVPLARIAKVGDLVEHRGAALGGQAATVLEIHKREAVLLMEFLGRACRTRAPLAELEVMGKSSARGQ